MTTNAKSPGTASTNRTPKRSCGTDSHADEQRYARGFRAFRQGHYRQALGLFTRLLLGEPLNPRYLMASGACLQRLHRYEDALRPYCLCAAFSPTDLLCQLYIAQCLMALGKSAQAVEALRRLLAAPMKDDGQQALRQHAQMLLDTLLAATHKE
ncbi:tetratricopeptide repeat protein [Robbsia sp. Bb-Pol-6]|uniref:Tetratricopeptide repeat protein n=1 Tax=Robbsia betulipollinis TaxID=2981849 RepID=A0ABT3ZV44_9BURK|nr:tetratricopeptide repeat protein [Robbsia betulipollinis]MCY0389765.1 tetratricopeptide repeat protein [Robbsia betulipollinis]